MTQQPEPTEILVSTPGLWLEENKVAFEQIEGCQFLTGAGYKTDQIHGEIDGNKVTYVPIAKNKVGWNLCSIQSGKDPKGFLPIDPAILNAPTKTYTEEEVEAARAKLHKEMNYWEDFTQRKTQLWNDIKNFIYQHLELPDERQYDVLTAWIFACWIPERWDTVPYIFFFGPMASGKTRALASLQYLAYRANFSISCSPAALFRSIEKYNVIPFLDEAEVYNSEDAVEIIACLNAGYKRESGYVQRFQGDCENGDVVNFRVFGFKAIAGTDKIKNTLESRSVIIRMARNTRDVNIFIQKKQAQHIRDELLQWRFWALQNLELPSAEAAEAAEACGEGCIPKEFMDMHNSRVIELFLPLYFVSDGETRKAIIDYAKSVYADQQDEDSAGEEAEVVRALLLCHLSVDGGKLELKTIFETVNNERSEGEKFKHTKIIGKILWRLGFKKTTVGKAGRAGIIWSEEKFKQLLRRYLPDASAASAASANPPTDTSTTQTPLTEPSQTGKYALADLDNVAACTVLDKENRLTSGCAICSKNTDLTYQIEFFNHNKGNICTACGSRILEHLQRQEEHQ